MKALVVEASLNSRSRSKILGEFAKGYLSAKGFDVDVFTQVEMELLPMAGSRHQQTMDLNPYRQKVKSADVLIFSFPIYCSTMSGNVKNFLDLFSQQMAYKWFCVLAAAGSERSHLAVRDFMSAMIFECKALVLPDTLVASPESFGENGELTQETQERLVRILSRLTQCADRISSLPVPIAEVQA